VKAVTIYGFKCAKKDEKVLMQRVNDFLATHHRTTSKSKNEDMLRVYAPLTIKHFYWNLNKEMGTWFDIYPNEDLLGEYFFPDHQDCGWLMHVRLDVHRHADIVKEKSEAYVSGVLKAAEFEYVVLAESDNLMEGLTRRGHPAPIL
jgi:hypothetical protein